jgi:hypothetical protein
LQLAGVSLMDIDALEAPPPPPPAPPAPAPAAAVAQTPGYTTTYQKTQYHADLQAYALAPPALFELQQYLKSLPSWKRKLQLRGLQLRGLQKGL